MKSDTEIFNQILQQFSCTSYEEMESITNDPADLEIITELKRLSQDEEFKEKLRKEIIIKEEDCIPSIKITVIRSNEMEGL